MKVHGESGRIAFRLLLASVRNVKAARAVLADCGGDADALKEAEPWLFADAVRLRAAGRRGRASQCRHKFRRGRLKASATPESGCALVASGRICAEVKCVGLGFTLWDGIVWASSKTAYTYFRIETASIPGYLTAS